MLIARDCEELGFLWVQKPQRFVPNLLSAPVPYIKELSRERGLSFCDGDYRKLNGG